MALPAVEDLEKVLFATQLVCELDHLESQPAGTQAPRGEHDERPDNHSPTRPVQRLGRNHRTKRTPSEGGVLAASETGFGRLRHCRMARSSSEAASWSSLATATRHTLPVPALTLG